MLRCLACVGSGFRRRSRSRPLRRSLGWLPPSRRGQAAPANPFDSTVVHKIAVRYDEAEYDKMVEDFVATGEKDWIKATVTVDGTPCGTPGCASKATRRLMGLRRGAAGARGPGSGRWPYSGPAGARTAADAPRSCRG